MRHRLHHGDCLHIHLFDPHICAAFNSKDHPVDILFFSLDLHADAAIPFIPDSTGAVIEICGLPGTVPEANTLHPAIENDVFTDHVSLFLYATIILAIIISISRYR